ncbi:MAG TPA: hypothetical protein VEX37_02745 [Thermomicrobiales bacterium]|nr:hypothetical protein [Thermomicrobiales bacterium]
MVDRDIKRSRSEQILTQSNEAWLILMEDPELRREIEAEDAAWEATLLDGLEDEEW